MKRLVLLAIACLAACNPGRADAPQSPNRSLTIFAAASLSDAFQEIGAGFEAAHPGVSLIFNFAGSPSLRSQIEEGAPVDVFASASGKEMDALVTSGQVAEGAPQFFLTNQLVVILPADNPAALASLEGLATPGVKLVLAAEEVPVGNYSRQSLELMNAEFGGDFSEMVLANVVSNEDNVKQVVTKVSLGEADAGIVYTSDAVAAPELQQIQIPTALNIIAKYPIAAVSGSPNADLADVFVAFVLSAEAQSILDKWGFLPPP